MTPASNHPIHPWYGPCDALANGGCAECLKEFERLKAALIFYRDGFTLHPKRTITGIDLSTWKPKKTLLEDCGEVAISALEKQHDT